MHMGRKSLSGQQRGGVYVLNGRMVLARGWI